MLFFVKFMCLGTCDDKKRRKKLDSSQKTNPVVNAFRIAKCKKIKQRLTTRRHGKLCRTFLDFLHQRSSFPERSSKSSSKCSGLCNRVCWTLPRLRVARFPPWAYPPFRWTREWMSSASRSWTSCWRSDGRASTSGIVMTGGHYPDWTICMQCTVSPCKHQNWKPFESTLGCWLWCPLCEGTTLSRALGTWSIALLSSSVVLQKRDKSSAKLSLKGSCRVINV